VNFERAQLAYDDLSRQLKLASDQSKNNLDNAQMSENDLIIRSDLDGVVYKINIQQGELANIASPLAVIGQKNFILELSIDEFDVVKIEPGQKVIIRMDSYQNQVFHGRITYVYPMMNERTRTFKVEAVFSNSPKLLYPNLTLEANIVINEKSNVLTIPTRFLLNDSTVILENGTKRKVKIGLKDYTLCEIKSGIGVKDKITMPE
jgi:multidrug efflux pump subunit AcrA (membrane-fusion protein)